MAKRSAVQSKHSNFFKRPGNYINWIEPPSFPGSGAARAFKILGIELAREKRVKRQKARISKVERMIKILDALSFTKSAKK